jgi:hypothetical protein
MQGKDPEISIAGQSLDAIEIAVACMGAPCKREFVGCGRLQFRVILCLAHNVANDPTKTGFERSQRRAGALELLGIGWRGHRPGLYARIDNGLGEVGRFGSP